MKTTQIHAKKHARAKRPLPSLKRVVRAHECPECGQPMLRKGQERKHPDDYRHAKGCPLDEPIERQTMKPHQERVVAEKTELDAKRQKLTVFIGCVGNDTYRTLDAMEQSRLNRQLEAMTLYSNVLGERIAAFAP